MIEKKIIKKRKKKKDSPFYFIGERSNPRTVLVKPKNMVMALSAIDPDRWIYNPLKSVMNPTCLPVIILMPNG